MREGVTMAESEERADPAQEPNVNEQRRRRHDHHERRFGISMSINIVEAFATANKCYQAAIPLYPQGIMLHSIGVPQPTGAHDAYNTGDKVSYNGKHYVCTIDANTYAPDVYGWEEV